MSSRTHHQPDEQSEQYEPQGIDRTCDVLLDSIKTSVNSSSSILLIGEPRTGKSTLGVIASVSLRRRVVDYDGFIRHKERKGQSPSGRHESSSGQLPAASDVAALHEFLSTYASDHVLICPSDICLSLEARSLLRRFARTNPVIHITSNLTEGSREGEAATAGEMNNLIRSCSTYEYFNLCEEHTSNGEKIVINEVSEAYTPPPYLRLKKVEQDFVRFITLVLKLSSPPAAAVQSGIIGVPSAPSVFTYALSLRLSEATQAIDRLEVLVRDGVDAVELEIDHSERPDQKQPLFHMVHQISHCVTAIRRQFTGPLIYRVQSPRLMEEKEYLSLLVHGVRLRSDILAVDLTNCEPSIRQIISDRRGTAIMGDLHVLSPTALGWNDPERMRNYNRAVSLGCQFVRITQNAKSHEDNLAVAEFRQRAKRIWPAAPHLIAYNTGQVGKTSLCFNELFTPVCHPLQLGNSASTFIKDASITIPQSQQALFSSFVFRPCILYIIGKDVSASLTPAAYRAALSHYAMPHDFTARSMASISELNTISQDDSFGGASIAQGLKVDVLSHVRFMSAHAKVIGAVNTLIPIRCQWDVEGPPPLEFWLARNTAQPIRGLYGENTDWIGFYSSISERLSPVNAVNHSTSGLVLGAGGTARAAIYALIQLGVRYIFISNRTVSKAKTLATYFNDLTQSQCDHQTLPWRYSAEIHVLESRDQPWPAEFSPPSIIISCVRARPGSLEPSPDKTVPSQWLGSPHGGVVVEPGYEPLLSDLVLQMRPKFLQGWVVVDGLEVLSTHCIAQFELITGRKAPGIRTSIALLKQYQALGRDRESSHLISHRLKSLSSRLGSIDNEPS